jgi:hypothetical protein
VSLHVPLHAADAQSQWMAALQSTPSLQQQEQEQQWQLQQQQQAPQQEPLLPQLEQPTVSQALESTPPTPLPM